MPRHTGSTRHSMIDAHIGSRLRERRTLVGLTQHKLAASLGISFQQVQKYECGVNRVSVSRLYDLANALDIPVSFFFDGMSSKLATATPSVPLPDAVELDPLMIHRETLEVMRAYYAVPVEARESVYRLLKSIARSASAVAASNVETVETHRKVRAPRRSIRAKP
jgi:transcriptional regulator with XRE-family HTH domain